MTWLRRPTQSSKSPTSQPLDPAGGRAAMTVRVPAVRDRGDLLAEKYSRTTGARKSDVQTYGCDGAVRERPPDPYRMSPLPPRGPSL
jgi:hypothetical protein